MKLVKQADLKYRILGYGTPKAGKTRLMCAFPEEWGRAAYIAADPEAERLDSVLPVHRDRIDVFKPVYGDSSLAVLTENTAIATGDWKQNGYGVLIWDTMTYTAMDLLDEYAKLGKFTSTGPMVFGTKGTPEYHAHPTPGDFGAAQSTVYHLIRHLFKQPLHVIVLCHSGWTEPKGGDGAGLIGGPATVGAAQIKELSGMFTGVIHCEASRPRRGQGEGNPVYTAYNNPHGIWQAGTRMPGTLRDIPLGPDPSHFWVEWEAGIRGENK